jgi:aryl-alcohol dehydrogenase-like predicted oxidoreductase
MKDFAGKNFFLPPIGLGTGLGDYKKKTDYSEKLFKNYYKLTKEYNIKLIDTSPVYGKGMSEKLIGKYFGKDRKNFFIATKILPEMCEKKK